MTFSSTFYFILIILSPLTGLIFNVFFSKTDPTKGSKASAAGVWLGFMGVIFSWAHGLPFSEGPECMGLRANEISWLMAALILFISGIVHHFSMRYFLGDRNYRRYFLLLTSITISTLLMVVSDNLAAFIVFWWASNFILTKLMIHKSNWIAAKNSGVLATRTFLMGIIFLSAGAALLAYECKTLSLHVIADQAAALRPSTRILSLFFIILAAFTQSGGWPFHKWLISSLNSPTPVSSLMHAGLVNGAGLLLTRFAAIFFNENIMLDCLFVFGVITLVLGGIWKLLQSDVKRMLACSTMTQMGFMIMQCGLGLFSAALAHLCWHGLFKSFLFLRTGSTIGEEKRRDIKPSKSAFTFLIACLIGGFGALGFILGNGLPFLFHDTRSILIVFAWIAGAQMARSLLESKKSLFSIFIASILCTTIGFVYGLTVDMIEKTLFGIDISNPQFLNPVHLTCLSFIVLIWICMNLKIFTKYKDSIWWKRFYVRMLNASQPDPKTITSNRNTYKF